MIEPTTHKTCLSPRIIAVAGIFACLAQQAAAATPEGMFAARGIGAMPCESIATADGDERIATIANLSSWIAGYVTHANRTTPDRFDVTPVVDNTVLASMVAQFCLENPTALVESVFASVLRSTSAGGQQAESELIELRNDQSVATVRAGTLRLVQQALADGGLLAQSDVDGAFGPRTGAALSAFQQQRGLSQTGLPDPVTLLNLFNAPSE